MPKLSIYEAIFVEREVEIPEKCPRCGESFMEGTGLLEIDHVIVELHGHVDHGNEGDFACEYHGNMGDVYHAALFQCGTCATVIESAGNHTIGKDEQATPMRLAMALEEAREG